LRRSEASRPTIVRTIIGAKAAALNGGKDAALEHRAGVPAVAEFAQGTSHTCF
jgi:hypothetical protein